MAVKKAQAVCDAAVVKGSWKKPGLFSIDFVFAVCCTTAWSEWFEAQTKNDGKKEVASKNFARANAEEASREELVHFCSRAAASLPVDLR